MDKLFHRFFRDVGSHGTSKLATAYRSVLSSLLNGGSTAGTSIIAFVSGLCGSGMTGVG